MRAERGFTLVEVLMVLLVLATGLLGYLQTVLLAMRIDEQGRGAASALALAQERIERIGAAGWEATTAHLPHAPSPELLGVAESLPREELTRDGRRHLVVFSREQEGAPPRCTVHCFWQERGQGYQPGRVVRLSTRAR